MDHKYVNLVSMLSYLLQVQGVPGRPYLVFRSYWVINRHNQFCTPVELTNLVTLVSLLPDSSHFIITLNE